MARRSKRRGRKRERLPERWDRLAGWVQHAICLALLLVVSLGFFAPVHFSGKSLVANDNVQWRAMAESLFEHEAQTGEQSLWAPNAFAGMPAYMINYREVIPQLDDAAQALRDVIWPTSHLIFLLVGVYLLVVLLSGNKLAGVLGAVAYGLTTYIPLILVSGHNTKFIALCFAPWLALAFAYALRRPKLLAALLFAAALALNLRAGHVQITYYMTFLLGIWWLVEGTGAYRHGALKRFGASTGWLALGSMLGLLMVAQPYLANYEYKAFTIRGSSAGAGGGGGGLDFSYAMNWSQGWGELVTLLIPGAYGGGGSLYWGPKPFTAGPHYVGGIVLLLAGLALWRYRRRVTWGMGIGAFLMVLFSLGSHFLLLNRPMFEYFPLFDAFRVPETWLSVVAFALAVLAAMGLTYLVRREPSEEDEQRKTKSVYIATGAAIGVVLLFMGLRGAFFDFERPDERQQVARQLVQRIAQQQPNMQLSDPRVQQAVRQRVQQYMARVQEERAGRFSGDAGRTLIFLVLAGAVLVAYRREWLSGWAACAALVALVTIDLGGVGRRYLNEAALSSAQDAEAQIANYGFDQYILKQQEAAGGPGHFRVLSLESGNPMTNARPAYHYQTLGGYHGAKLRLYQDFIDHLFRDPQTNRPNEQALDLLNTRYVVAPQRLPGYRVAYQDEQTGMFVLENQDALPRAFFVGQTEVVSSPEETYDRLLSEDFNPRKTALLPEPIDFDTTPLDSADTASAELQSYTANRIVWSVETDAPRLLVVSELYYPAGWEATLDGEEVPIYRADHLLRAVPVPEGEHTLVMRFAPRSHTAGVWVSGISTVHVYGGILGLVGRAYMRRRKDPDEEEVDEGAKVQKV